MKTLNWTKSEPISLDRSILMSIPLARSVFSTWIAPSAIGYITPFSSLVLIGPMVEL